MQKPNEVIDLAVECLSNGETLLYPTDTIWGLGCDACNGDAVESLYAIKCRDHSKSMLVLCDSIGMVERYVGEVSSDVERLLTESDRPTTVIMPLVKKLVDNGLRAADGTIGVRIPRMDFCLGLIGAFGKPIVSTSANFSGRPSPKSYQDIDERIKKTVGYCVPSVFDVSHETKGSRIVKLSVNGDLLVIRD